MLKKGVYAGTFGPLHNGHMYIMETALEVVDHLVIGITLDSIAQKKVKDTGQYMPTFAQRVKAVSTFLSTITTTGRYSIVPVSDGIKDAVDFDGDVLFISDEPSVMDRAQHIMLLRSMKKSGRYMAIMILPRLRFSDGTVISSTDIRKARVKKEV